MASSYKHRTLLMSSPDLVNWRLRPTPPNSVTAMGLFVFDDHLYLVAMVKEGAKVSSRLHLFRCRGNSLHSPDDNLSWMCVTQAPGAVWDCAISLVGCDVLFIGGWDGRTSVSSTHSFNLVSGVWQADGLWPKMPIPLAGASTAVAGQRLTLVGGFMGNGGQQVGNNRILSLDIQTVAMDAGATGPAMEQRQAHLDIVASQSNDDVIDNDLTSDYDVTLPTTQVDGENTKSVVPMPTTSRPSTEAKWRVHASCSPNFTSGATTLHNMLCVGGGSSRNAPSGSCSVFDPVLSQWIPLPTLQQPRRRPAMLHWHGKLVCIGGSLGNGKYCNSVETLDLQPKH